MQPVGETGGPSPHFLPHEQSEVSLVHSPGLTWEVHNNPKFKSQELANHAKRKTPSFHGEAKTDRFALLHTGASFSERCGRFLCIVRVCTSLEFFGWNTNWNAALASVMGSYSWIRISSSGEIPAFFPSQRMLKSLLMFSQKSLQQCCW